MKQIKVKYGDCVITFVHQRTASFVTEGYVDEDGFVPGYESFEIPKSHIKPFKKFYKDHFDTISRSVGINLDEWEEVDGEYHDSDLFIYWLHFLINTRKRVTIPIACEHLFWPIHDGFHALKDFYDKTFQCTAYEEVNRHIEAYEILKANKMQPDNRFLEQVIDAFNARNWGCNYAMKRKGINISIIKGTVPFDWEKLYS